MTKHTIGDLVQMRSLPLSAKVRMTQYRIRQWYEEFDGNVYVSFSGGKDSSVLLDIVREMYPETEAVFVNTGLEYPSVRKFALSIENVTEVRPEISFREVVLQYGYPLISKEVAKRVYEYRKYKNTNRFKQTCAYQEFNGLRKQKNERKSSYNKEKYKFLTEAPFVISHFCCLKMKEAPTLIYEEQTGKKPIMATMAEESRARMKSWLESGCNAFDAKRQTSQPMSFWTENDVLEYIHKNELQIAEAYGDVIVKPQGERLEGQINIYDVLKDYRDCKFCTTGCKRTGCVFCLFGIRQDIERIANLQEKEPSLADYVLRGGEFSKDGMWQPSKDGLGYWFVLDWLAANGYTIPYKRSEYYRKNIR